MVDSKSVQMRLKSKTNLLLNKNITLRTNYIYIYVQCV